MTRGPQRLAISNSVTISALAAVSMLAGGCARAAPVPVRPETSAVDTPAAAVSTPTPTPTPTPTTPPPDASVTPTPTTSPPDAAGTPSPAKAIPASCAILTRTDARALIAGAALNPGTEVPATDPAYYSSSCTYDAPPTAPSGQVEIFVTREVPNALTINQSIKHKFRTVAGIGDKTLEEPDNSNIFIHKGDLWVYLSIPFGANAATLERGARLIASRMP